MSVTLHVDALQEMQRFFEQAPKEATRAARMAINQVARGEGLALMRDEVNKEVNFPDHYVKDHLGLSKPATDGDLSAVITGRDRPTSLARFAYGQTPENSRRRGVRVEVHRGHSVLMEHAFLIRLKNNNIGLALRLRKGETLKNKREMAGAVPFGRDAWLLYGPSVDQVFAGAIDARQADLLDLISAAFYDKFGRVANG